MKDQTEGARLLRRHASGELCADSRPVSEPSESADEDEDLLALEDDLFDDYLSGELSEEDREKFSDFYLDTADGREKLEFAAVLRCYIERTAGAGPPDIVSLIRVNDGPFPATARRYSRRVRVAIISACVVAGVVLTFGFIKSHQRGANLKVSVTNQLSENTAQKSSVTAGDGYLHYDYDADRTAHGDQKQLPKTSLPLGNLYPKSVMVCFFPASMIDTGDTPKKISIPATTERLRLQLGFPGDFSKAYSVQLQNGGGRNVFRQHGLTMEPLVSGTGIIFNVPTNILAPGNYRLELEETNPDGNSERLGVYKMEVAPTESRFD